MKSGYTSIVLDMLFLVEISTKIIDCQLYTGTFVFLTTFKVIIVNDIHNGEEAIIKKLDVLIFNGRTLLNNGRIFEPKSPAFSMMKQSLLVLYAGFLH